MECISGVKIYSCKIEQGSAPRYERERQAIEILVNEAFGSDARKFNHESGVPYIKIGDKKIESISISHSREYALLAVAPHEQCIGVDIEEYRPQLRRVAEKFLSEEERELFTTDEALLQAWTLKEAAYKALHIPGLALTDIHIMPESSLISASGHNLNILFSGYLHPAQFMSLVSL